MGENMLQPVNRKTENQNISIFGSYSGYLLPIYNWLYLQTVILEDNKYFYGWSTIDTPQYCFVIPILDIWVCRYFSILSTSRFDTGHTAQ